MWDIRNLEEKDEVKAVMALNKDDTQHAHRDRVLCLMFEGDTLVTGGRCDRRFPRTGRAARSHARLNIRCFRSGTKR